MPTGSGAIDVSNCSSSFNNGSYNLTQNTDGTWNVTGPTGCGPPAFSYDSVSGNYQFTVGILAHACINALWSILPDGAPDSDGGRCTGTTIDAYGF